MAFDCKNCPLRRQELFDPLSEEDVRFMRSIKRGEARVLPGAVLYEQGEKPQHVYTVLFGMGLRAKTMADGHRQIVNFVMPGDFIGLQAGVMGEMRHSVEATTAMTLCVFDRADLWKIFQANPKRAFDLTYLAALEEHLLGEALSRLGQHGAMEKIAWSFHRVHARAKATDALGADGSCPLPYRQQDLADALGLSLVHTNKTLSRLKAEGVASWARGRLRVTDPNRLAELGRIEDSQADSRPLI